MFIFIFLVIWAHPLYPIRTISCDYFCSVFSQVVHFSVSFFFFVCVNVIKICKATLSRRARDILLYGLRSNHRTLEVVVKM